MLNGSSFSSQAKKIQISDRPKPKPILKQVNFELSISINRNQNFLKTEMLVSANQNF